MLLSQCRCGSKHSCTGRKTVIDENDNAPLHVGRGTIITVEVFSPFKFPLLFCYNCIDHLLRDMQHVHDLFVDHTYPSRCNSAHRQFLVTRDAKFAHNKDIEGGLKCLCHFITNWHTSTRECQHQHILALSICCEFRGYLTPGFPSISIDFYHDVSL